MQPFFSIITCTYNSEHFIEKNLRSILNQKCQDYEQVVIDGYSKDKTVKLVNRYKNKGLNVKVFKKIPKGISNAFNEGVKKSSGKYIFFLNSDDSFFDSKVLESVKSYLRRHQELDWIYAKINVVDDGGKKVGVFPRRNVFQTSNKLILKYFSYIPHQAVFMKKEVFNKLGSFDESLSSSMDTDLWYRLMNKTKWHFFNKIIADYTLRSDAETSSRKNRKKNILVLEKVQLRYLGIFEMKVARVINRLVDIINKTYR